MFIIFIYIFVNIKLNFNILILILSYHYIYKYLHILQNKYIYIIFRINNILFKYIFNEHIINIYLGLIS